MSTPARWASAALLLATFGLAALPGGADDGPRSGARRLLVSLPESQATEVPPKTPAHEPTAADVPYGPHPRNVLDFWQAKSETPTPLIVYIHGGGFVGGDKSSIDGRMIAWARRDGISVAALNYRFVTTDPFPAPMHDAARAIQFLRSKADRWNIDPERIAAFGGSAGAGISMWLGFHEDLADPESPDRLARESTRLAAVGSVGGQSTYDPLVIRELIGGRAWQHPSLLKCYGLASFDEVDDPKHQAAYDEASALTHLSADDAPVFMIYSEPDRPLPPHAGPGVGIHHPKFGHLLKQRMDELGIESVYRHSDESPALDLRRELYEFLRDHLRAEPEAH